MTAVVHRFLPIVFGLSLAGCGALQDLEEVLEELQESVEEAPFEKPARCIPTGDEVPYDGLDNDCDHRTLDDDLDGDGHLARQDCNDLDPSIAPTYAEIPYDGIDNDCRPKTPDDDLDGDGVGRAEDCDDGNPDISPLRLEIPYDGIDNDCDAETSDGDVDGDGFLAQLDCDDEDPSITGPCPAATPPNPWIDQDGDGYPRTVDCDDMNEYVYPGAADPYYDGIDANCDGASDFDADGDGFDDVAGVAYSRQIGIVRPLSCEDDIVGSLDPVLGCGPGTDCDDDNPNRNILQLPIVLVDLLDMLKNNANDESAWEILEGLAVPPPEGLGLDPQGTYLASAPEECEAGAQVDSDCSGSVNRSRTCVLDVETWVERQAAHREAFPDSDLALEAFVHCVEPTGEGWLWVDRRNTAGVSPEVLSLQEDSRFAGVLYDPQWVGPEHLNNASSGWFPDEDRDGFASAHHQPVYLCDPAAEGTGWSQLGEDCDDRSPSVRPGAIERCDAMDNDCDGEIDEVEPLLNREGRPQYQDDKCEWHYRDLDGDSFGKSNQKLCLCPDLDLISRSVGQAPAFSPHGIACQSLDERTGTLAFGHLIDGVCYARNGADCDDRDGDVYPGAPDADGDGVPEACGVDTSAP